MSKVGLQWDHPTWYPCRCPKCGWEGMSSAAAGGQGIADTGEYEDAVCPVCIAPGGDYKSGHWVPVQDIPQPNYTSGGGTPATPGSGGLSAGFTAGNGGRP